MVEGGVTVHSVAIGENADTKLDNLSKATEGLTYFVSSSDLKLYAKFKQIADEISSQCKPASFLPLEHVHSALGCFICAYR
jgi:hypothetical protein